MEFIPRRFVLAAARVVVFCWMAVPGALIAQDSSREVTLTDVEGRAVSGTLQSLDDSTVILSGNVSQGRRTADLISISWPRNKRQPRDIEPVVLLANGDFLGLVPERVTDEAFIGRWTRFPGWPSLKLPLEIVKGAIVTPPADGESRFRLLDQLASHTAKSDLLILQNGDTLAGQWQGLDGGKIHWKSAAGKVELEQSAVQAVCLNPSLINIPVSPDHGAICRLTDGSSLILKGLHSVGSDKLAGSLPGGPEFEATLSAVSDVSFFGGRVTYLSDLKPESYKFTPYLSQDWPLRKDRTVQGGLLRLRGVDYAKGLGMHSRSEAVYRLNGRYRRFQATIGIDDDAEGKGSCVFEVRVDGKASFKSRVLTGASPALAIPPIDVSGARTLTLIVDFATMGDIQDHADWCQALLVK